MRKRTGRKEGRMEGRQEGRKEGRKKGRKERNLVEMGVGGDHGSGGSLILNPLSTSYPTGCE